LTKIARAVTAETEHNPASLARFLSLRGMTSAPFLWLASMKGATANLDASQRPATTPRCYNGTGRDICAAANRTDSFRVLFRRRRV